jgi:hypothetical protein
MSPMDWEATRSHFFLVKLKGFRAKRILSKK